MKNYPLRIIVAKDYAELSKIAANKVLIEVNKKPDLILSLPTGETPLGMYQHISKMISKKKASFSKATFFELDEFILDKAHKKLSFKAYLEKNLFQKSDFSAKKINFFNNNLINFKEECKAYEKKISKKKPDLVVLGIGLNGHIAFNSPKSSIHSKTRIVELNCEDLNQHYRKKGHNTKGAKAFTIGIANIIKAKKIIMLVSGKHKSKIMQKFLKMSKKPKVADVKKLPALALCFHPHVEIIADLKALS